jgi:hypothetical protein
MMLIGINNRVGDLSMMKNVSSPSSNGGSLSAAVSSFQNGASVSTVKAAILDKLDGFAQAPAAQEQLQKLKNSLGGNLLHHVANFEKEATYIAPLVSLGVDINATNTAGVTPLFFAVVSKTAKPEMIESLLSQGADPNVQHAKTGNPLLVQALLTAAPVANLEVLLTYPNVEIPTNFKLSSGREMSVMDLVARSYSEPDRTTLTNLLTPKNDGVA